MNGSRISIELAPEAPPDVIELLAVAPCTLAATAMADGEGIRFASLDGTKVQNARTDAAMTIVVADACSCVTIEPPPGARLAVAIVAVESSFDPDFVSSAFDAVLPIVVAEGTRADAARAAALRAVVSCVAASLVSMVIEDAQRFFLGAGRLSLGRGEAADIASDPWMTSTSWHRLHAAINGAPVS